MLTYKLLDNNGGVILSRQPEVVEKELTVHFDGAPENATAVFETESGDSYYRILMDGECSLPIERISGSVKVTVLILDDPTGKLRWYCEGLKADKLQSGETLITPDDMNLPDAVAALRLENQEIRKTCKDLEERFTSFEEQLERIMEGYSVT